MAVEQYAAQIALLVRLLPHVAKEKIFALKGVTAINLLNLDQPYTQEFPGMARMPVSLGELLNTRERLVGDIQSRFDDSTKQFLLSLHDGMPDVSAIDRHLASDLPAVRWKLFNLEKLKNDNAAKHAEQRAALEALLG